MQASAKQSNWRVIIEAAGRAHALKARCQRQIKRAAQLASQLAARALARSLSRPDKIAWKLDSNKPPRARQLARVNLSMLLWLESL